MSIPFSIFPFEALVGVQKNPKDTKKAIKH